MASSGVFKDEEAGASLVASNSDFALRLYRALTEGKTQNTFFSPVSISIALGMTLLGAKENTAAEMKTTLFNEVDESKLHGAVSELNSFLSSPSEEYKLLTANRLFAEQSYDFLSEFLESTKANYGAELAKVNFKENYEEARQNINQWVEEQTARKITHLMPEGSLDSLTRLVLVNAIYFKGNWDRQFDKNWTADLEFYVSDTETIEVPTMWAEEEFNFGLNRDLDDTKILELPYRGNKLSMFILLPDQSLANLEAKLSMSHLKDLRKSFRMRKYKTNVQLPRFKLEQSFELKDALAQLGVKDLFDDSKADLSGVDGSRELYVGKVIHKAFINVDEEGSEAAAATGVTMQLRCIPKIMEFHCNKPFMFFIRDNISNSILFLGRCLRP